MMNRFQKESHSILKKLILPLGIFLVLILIFLTGLDSVSSASQKEQQKALETSIKRSVIHCYAVEGRYPASISYLEDHYGIVYDHSKYIIDYEITGSNLMPGITVIPLQN